MRGHVIMSRALQHAANGDHPKQILDLGAGDGDFLLHVARRLAVSWPVMKAILLDRQQIVTPQTVEVFATLGWRAEVVGGDVFKWARTAADEPVEAVVANLFLHHFSDPQLVGLFRAISRRTRLFVALEPRRGCWPLLCSRLLGCIGCNAVTRHDAVVSVRAGFVGGELSAFWPAADGWQLTERPVWPFSHLFVAQRIR
ncbi:MAG: methyltransferase domain-containing protein [Verrucomicrobia bacterium]|nr:methyltransferase domain-containing protein [Verrucomicrobiota bacterium]